MPIYEYDCRKCGHHFEALIRRDADLPKRCPSCGAAKPVKAFSAFAVGATDPAAHCQSCPSAEASCAGGACSSSGCPFSG